jgi:hypothetical protein
MTTTTIPRRAKRLLNYLQSNNGIEYNVFTDSLGNPDLSGARSFAEKFREIHKDYIGDLVEVEQSFNKVTITVIP